MKALKIYTQLVCGTPVLCTSNGFRVIEARKKLDEQHPARYAMRVGGKSIGTYDREIPDVVTVNRAGGRPPLRLIYDINLRKVEIDGGVTFFTMAKPRGESDLRIALFIDTKGVEGGSGGDYTVSPSHLNGLPYEALKDEKGGSYYMGLTVLAPGETITVTPQGGTEVILRYDVMKGVVFDKPFAVASSAIPREGESQKKRKATQMV